MSVAEKKTFPAANENLIRRKIFEIGESPAHIFRSPQLIARVCRLESMAGGVTKRLEEAGKHLNFRSLIDRDKTRRAGKNISSLLA